MKTYFEKNETANCKCGEKKSPKEIFCEWCANYWNSLVAKQHLPFVNSNSSVQWMNLMHNDIFGKMSNALCPRAAGAIG